MTLQLPEFAGDVHSRLTTRLITNISGFPAQVPDTVRIRVYNTTTGTLVVDVTQTPTNQSWSGAWNVSTLAGAHNMTVESAAGNATKKLTLRFNITAPPTTTSTLRRFETYGHSYGAVTKHVYTFVQNAECGPTFYISVRGDAGTDMDLFVNQGAPTDTLDGNTYSEKHNDTDRDEFMRWEGAAPLLTYYVLVQQESGAETPYVLRYETTPQAGADCDQGGTSGEAPTATEGFQGLT